MANPDAVGTTGTPFPAHVERGKIIEFAYATGRATSVREPARKEGI